MNEPEQWLAYAIDDLAYGELGMDSLPRAASWSFQQASEKSLKALLLANQIPIQRTHDVAYLLTQLSGTLDLPGDLTEAALLIAEITPATRDPSDDSPMIDAPLAAEYHQAAKHIVEWATQQLKH